MDLIEASPDDLTDSLAYALLKHREALKQWLSRHERDYDDTIDRQLIARALVEHLKRTGIEKVVRRQSRAHGMLKPAG